MIYSSIRHFVCKQKIQLFTVLSCTFFLTACLSTVQLYHTSADGLIEQGIQAESVGNISAATMAYEEAAKLSGRGNMYLGNLAYSRKDFAEAEQQYRLALRDIPGNAALYNNLAWSLLKQNHKLAEAEEFARLAVQRSDQKTLALTWETLNTVRKSRQTNEKTAAVIPVRAKATPVKPLQARTTPTKIAPKQTTSPRPLQTKATPVKASSAQPSVVASPAQKALNDQKHADAIIKKALESLHNPAPLVP